MKPWLKRTLIGTVTLFGAVTLLGALGACSHQGHHRQGWHAMSDEDAARFKARFIARAGEKLELDEAQKAKLGLLADKLREQRNAFVGDTKDPRAELGSLIAGPTFDRNKAQVLVQGKTQAVQTKSPEVIAALADFYDSLKPEQQAKVREYLQRGRRGWRG
ncbi:MAG: Spy/CpxP family protein refolding chaperone [Burkholderiales bacterium]|nr:Spy/CpxP family protein refolding chaperone [Burkholderiales bacterium]